MDRGEFIKDGFTCQRGANGGWSVFPLYGVEKAYFTSFTEMCDWLEDQHEGLVIGEMAKKHPMMEVPAGEMPAGEMPVGPYPRVSPAVNEVPPWVNSGVEPTSANVDAYALKVRAQEEVLREAFLQTPAATAGLRLEPLAPGHFLVMRSPEKDADDE